MKLENHPERTGRGSSEMLKEAASDPVAEDSGAGGGKIGGKPGAARDRLKVLLTPASER